MFAQNERLIDSKILQAKVVVKNDRKSYDVVRKDSNFRCEVSLDSVDYMCDGETCQDWQVEIELKSQDAIHRIELQEFAKKYRASLGIETEMKETLSKYCKALQVFRLVKKATN